MAVAARAARWTGAEGGKQRLLRVVGFILRRPVDESWMDVTLLVGETEWTLGKLRGPQLWLDAVLRLAIGCENWIQAVVGLELVSSGPRTVVGRRGEAG